jgi:hypothetical protein
LRSIFAISSVSLISKRDLGCQRSQFNAEEEILHEIEIQLRTSTRRIANLSVCSLAASSKRRSGNSSKQMYFELNSAFLDVPKLALQIMAGILTNFFDVSFYAFTHSYSVFPLLFPE